MSNLLNDPNIHRLFPGIEKHFSVLQPKNTVRRSAPSSQPKPSKRVGASSGRAKVTPRVRPKSLRGKVLDGRFHDLSLVERERWAGTSVGEFLKFKMSSRGVNYDSWLHAANRNLSSDEYRKYVRGAGNKRIAPLSVVLEIYGCWRVALILALEGKAQPSTLTGISVPIVEIMAGVHVMGTNNILSDAGFVPVLKSQGLHPVIAWSSTNRLCFLEVCNGHYTTCIYCTYRSWKKMLEGVAEFDLVWLRRFSDIVYQYNSALSKGL